MSVRRNIGAIGRADSVKPLNPNTNVQDMTIASVSFGLHLRNFERKLDAALMTLDFEEITESLVKFAS